MHRTRLGLILTLPLFVLFFAQLQPSAATSPQQYSFQNPNLPMEDRIKSLLSLMTLDEKIACLGTNPSVPRLGIKASGHVEGIHGLAQGGPGKWGHPSVVPTTTFPQGIGLGETWDKKIVEQAAEIESYEARYIFQSSKYHQGGIVVRSPNADMGRDPRWGRTEECYGEDPFFNGTMVVAFVKGLQGNDSKYWRAAALMKHFLANSNENDRDKSSSNFDERLFREYYSVPFRMGVVEGGSRAFMASYNAVNGVPMTVNPILETVTRKEWGEDGIICTDAGAMRNLVTSHKYSADFEHAAAASVKAGIGQFLDNYVDAVHAALKDKLLTEADIDEALKGNFRVMIRLGLLDPPSLVSYSSIGNDDEPWTTEKHKTAALLATEKSIVLLKNSGGLLPLTKTKLKSVAVIGPRANDVWLDWYSGTPPYRVSPVDGLKKLLGDSVKLNTADVTKSQDAVAAAKASDVAIVCVGNHPNGGFDTVWAKVSSPGEGREAVDRQSIDLDQEELIRQVYAANPKTVVVLISSFPYAINWTQQNVPSILHMTHSSQEEGTALANVLFGNYNPAGRLVQTWPRSLDQLPPMMDYDIRHGRTYLYSRQEPLYPFGFGLSYSTFTYSNLRTSAANLSSNGTLTVTLDVKNNSSRGGDEVVQMYVRHLNSSVSRPVKELKDFDRVYLEPQQTKTVTLSLPASRLAYWSVDRHQFVVEKDRIEVVIGGSSKDESLRKVVNIK